MAEENIQTQASPVSSSKQQRLVIKEIKAMGMLPSPCTWWFSNVSFGCQLLDPRCAKCSSRGLRPPSCTSQCWQLQVAGRHWGSPAVPVALLTSPCIPTSSSLVLGCVWKLCLVKGKGSQSVQFCPQSPELFHLGRLPLQKALQHFGNFSLPHWSDW